MYGFLTLIVIVMNLKICVFNGSDNVTISFRFH